MTDKPYQTKHEVRILAADIKDRFPMEWEEIDRLANDPKLYWTGAYWE